MEKTVNPNSHWIYVLETAGGKLVDIISDVSQIVYGSSPYYVLADKVEPMRVRLLELGYEEVNKNCIDLLIKEGYIVVCGDNW